MDELLEQICGMTAAETEACAQHLMVGGGTRGGPVLARGRGVRLYDPEGKDYIDCSSQSWAAYLGFANETIRQIVHEQMGLLFRAHQGFDTLPRFYLARKLAALAPGDLNRVAFTVGGGAAIESAMKIAYKNTQPSRDFLCLYDGYHGTTLGTMGASWVATRAAGNLVGGSHFLGITQPFVRVPNPYCYRCPLGLQRASCGLACAHMLRLTLERGVAGSVGLCELLLDETGVAILPGSAFGRPPEELTARISFVDFDGARALEGLRSLPLDRNPGAEFLGEYCGRTVEAVQRIGEWVSA